jgi:hypothetical protein
VSPYSPFLDLSTWIVLMVYLLHTGGGDLPSGQTYQCVFIDLASTRQHDPCYNMYRCDDYEEVKQILRDVGLRADLIEPYYEPREKWDNYGPFTDGWLL